MRKLTMAALLFAAFNFAQAQQLTTPKPSPNQTVIQDFGLGNIELLYSRPGLKGRSIGTDFVPYGKLWRTGANGATTISFSSDVEIGGKSLKAGQYGLLSIPGEKEWTVIITSDLNVNSPSLYKQANDLVRVTVPVKQLAETVETFTISFSNFTDNSCAMQLMWDHTLVEVPMTTNSDEAVKAEIDRIFNKDQKPYYAAARYYFDHNVDLQKAKEWIDIEAAKPESAERTHVWLLKAEIYQALGDKKVAKTASEKVIELANKGDNNNYKLKAQAILDSL